MSSELKELSILIVTWNGDELLKNCLESLRRAYGEVPEIVVVDNANLGSTKALVAAYPNAHYIAAPENLGFAGGNNLGLPLCTRPYVLLLNNDTVIHEEPFTQLIQYLKSHPKVAVVQGKMRLVRFGDVLDECGSYLTSWGELYFRYLHAPVSTKVESGPVFHAKGACLMFKRSILDDLSGVLFYDHFKSYYEDVDFCHRVWLTGNEVHFVDTPYIDHLQGATTEKIGIKKACCNEIKNKLFSFATTFSAYGKWTVGLKHTLLWGIVCLRYVIGFDFKSIKPHINAVISLIRDSSCVAKTKCEIQNHRTISDKELFAAALRKPPLLFYWKLLRGKMGNCTLGDCNEK